MTSLQADIVCAELPLCVVRLEQLAPLATSAAQAARQLDHPVSTASTWRSPIVKACR